MKARFLLVPVAFACVVSASAWAGDSGGYWGLNVGRTDVTFDASGGLTTPLTAAGGTLSAVSEDTSATAWKLFGGYQINRYFGAEAEYVDFGSYAFNGVFTSAGVATPISGSTKVKGWGVSAVGTIPLNDSFAFFGKLGIFRSREDTNYNVPGVIAGSGSDDENGPLYGVGIKYTFNETVSLRGEFERLTKVGDSAGNTEDTNISFYSLGVLFQY